MDNLYNVGDVVEITAKTKAKGNGWATEVFTGSIQEYKPDGWIVVNGKTFWLLADIRDLKIKVLKKAAA
jgi:hypothetical protein